MCSALRVCLSVSVVGSAEAFFQDNTYACYITTPIRHSLSPSLPNSKLFHLSFSLQQSTNSLSCQSKPTFMQPIINDTIHLARSLSLSSALLLFHPLSLEAPLKAWLPFRVRHKVLGLRWGSRLQRQMCLNMSHFTCKTQYLIDNGQCLRTVVYAFVILHTNTSHYNENMLHACPQPWQAFWQPQLDRLRSQAPCEYLSSFQTLKLFFSPPPPKKESYREWLLLKPPPSRPDRLLRVFPQHYTLPHTSLFSFPCDTIFPTHAHKGKLQPTEEEKRWHTVSASVLMTE